MYYVYIYICLDISIHAKYPDSGGRPMPLPQREHLVVKGPNVCCQLLLIFPVSCDV